MAEAIASAGRRDADHERELRAAGGVREGIVDEGVRERAGRQHDQRDGCGGAHRQVTVRVKGAVSTLPPTLAWMNSRQVPATGSRTPIAAPPG